MSAVLERAFSPATLGKLPLKNRFITVYLAILSLGVALSVLGGVLLARRLIRRIHKLSSATRFVAEGDLSVRVESGGSEDEVVVLGAGS